jgi:hypothetical protein
VALSSDSGAGAGLPGFGLGGGFGSASSPSAGGVGFGAGRAIAAPSMNMHLSQSSKGVGVLITFLVFMGPCPVLAIGVSQARRFANWSVVAGNLWAALQTDEWSLLVWRRVDPPDHGKDDHGFRPAVRALRTEHQSGSGNFRDWLGTVASWRQSLHHAPRGKDRGREWRTVAPDRWAEKKSRQAQTPWVRSCRLTCRRVSRVERAARRLVIRSESSQAIILPADEWDRKRFVFGRWRFSCSKSFGWRPSASASVSSVDNRGSSILSDGCRALAGTASVGRLSVEQVLAIQFDPDQVLGVNLRFMTSARQSARSHGCR